MGKLLETIKDILKEFQRVQALELQEVERHAGPISMPKVLYANNGFAYNSSERLEQLMDDTLKLFF